MNWNQLSWEQWDIFEYDDWDDLYLNPTYFGTVVEHLNFGQPYDGQLPAIADTLEFDSTAVGVLPNVIGGVSFDLIISNPRHGVVVDTLVFSDTLTKNLYYFEITDHLEFSSSIDTLTSILDTNHIDDNLTLGETITVICSRSRTVTDNLLLTDYVIGYITVGNRELIRSPIKTSNSIYSTYYGCTLSKDALSLTLPSAEFNNTLSLNVTRIQRESRGGTLQTKVDSIWPKYDTIHYVIEALSEDQRDDFLTFIDSTLGLEITLLDYNDKSWIGVITNPTTSALLPGCGYTVEFDFEGDIV